MEKKSGEFIPTRESLLSRLKDWEDDESWREFFGIYRKLLFGFALKAGLSEQESEEVVQETIISVAKTIKEFQYDPDRCSFKSWLRHLAQKRIADAFRRRARQPALKHSTHADSVRTPVVERLADPAAGNLDELWEEEWRAELLQAAIARVKAAVSGEQYQMFDFYVLKKMPVKKVADALGTSSAQVYLAKHRVSRLIKKEVARIEKQMP
ncbi:MAG TPA: sigma-70 family RNA polymerase sigma factor [Candidatus Polarisedimenticolia bacterium]|nr:sigma-70 family RNA polymerase sigma factor [Candidatus Polarisedimenticolia bacterium]